MSKEADIAVIHNCLDTLRAIVRLAGDVLEPGAPQREPVVISEGGLGIPMSELHAPAPGPAPMGEPPFLGRVSAAGGRKKYSRL